MGAFSKPNYIKLSIKPQARKITPLKIHPNYEFLKGRFKLSFLFAALIEIIGQIEQFGLFVVENDVLKIHRQSVACMKLKLFPEEKLRA